MVSEGEQASFPLHPRKPGVELDCSSSSAGIRSDRCRGGARTLAEAKGMAGVETAVHVSCDSVSDDPRLEAVLLLSGAHTVGNGAKELGEPADVLWLACNP